MRNIFKKGSAENRATKTDLKRFDKASLEEKAEKHEMMTYDEIQALQSFHNKDIMNEVLRIMGLLFFLVFVIFAVGSKLYGTSLFNLIDRTGGDYTVGDSFVAEWLNDTVTLAEPLTDASGNARSSTITIYELFNGSTDGSIMYNGRALVPVFTPGCPGSAIFLALGCWTIIPISTIVLVAIIWLSAYAFALSIQDLINMIHRFGRGTAQAIEAVVITGKQSVEDTIPAKEQKKESESPTHADDADRKEDVDAKIAKMKKDIAEEENVKTADPTSTVTPVQVVQDKPEDRKADKKALDSLADDDLNKLLSGSK